MSSIYTLIPRPIGDFAGLRRTERYAYGLIYDRWLLSKKNGMKDQYGVFCVFSRDAMAAEMGISLPTLREAINRLIKRELITSRLTGPGGSWRYYVLKPLSINKKPEPQKAKSGDQMLRYSPEERKETYSAAIVDFDEEG